MTGSKEKDSFWMRQALEQARLAYSLGEVPIGCVIVQDEEVVAKSYNQVERLKSASAHAELLALKEATDRLSLWRLTGSTLYSTLEPCPMCLGSIILHRVDRVVFGASDKRFGACGSFVDLLSSKPLPHTPEVVSGVMRDECRELIQQFFVELRGRKGN